MKRKSSSPNCENKKSKSLNIFEECEFYLQNIEDDSTNYENTTGVADYAKFLNLLKIKHSKNEEDNLNRLKIIPFSDVSIKKNNDEGDKRLHLFQQTLNNFHCTRSKLQEQFHEKFLQAVLSHIYKDKYEQNRRRLYKEFRVDKISKEIFICAPRRFGKTWSISMFVAACLYCIPGINISVFSTGKRASGALRDFVLKFFTQLPGAEEMIERVNQEVITVQPYNTSTMLEHTNAFFYPSNVKTLKGVSADSKYYRKYIFYYLLCNLKIMRTGEISCLILGWVFVILWIILLFSDPWWWVTWSLFSFSFVWLGLAWWFIPALWLYPISPRNTYRNSYV